MTNALESVRRLRAWHEGRPLPRGEKVNIHVGDDDEILCLAFVRMGGESLPWGCVVGSPTGSRRVVTVPDPRNRDLVADMMVEIGRIVLGHFGHPSYADGMDEVMSVYRHRQLWLPGGSHLELLHSIAFAYARTNRERGDIEVLRSFGQLANCLYVEAQRPGQQTVVVASQALTTVYDFPSSSMRQSHIGHLLGWLGREKTRETRLRVARDAEKRSVSATLDPDFERENLVSLVEEWNEPPREERLKRGGRAATAIAGVLGGELRHRFDLTTAALQVVRSDSRPVNPGVADLVRIGTDKFSRLWWDQVLRELSNDPDEKPYWPGLRGDTSARAAASAYQMRVAAARQAVHCLVHGDTALQDEELVRGHGVRGKISSIDGRGATWTVVFDAPEFPSLRIGGTVVIAGAPKLELKVVSISPDERTLVLAPQWTSVKASMGPLAKAADSPSWKGPQLVFIEDFPVNLTEQLGYRINARSDGEFDILDYFVAGTSVEVDQAQIEAGDE